MGYTLQYYGFGAMETEPQLNAMALALSPAHCYGPIALSPAQCYGPSSVSGSMLWP